MINRPFQLSQPIVRSLSTVSSHSSNQPLSIQSHRIHSPLLTRSFSSNGGRSRDNVDSSENPPLSADEVVIFALPRNLLVTTSEIVGYRVVEVVGLVSGNTVRVRNVALDYMARLRSLFGGELTTYTDLMMEAREEATERMIAECVELGGNAIVNIRVETSNLATNASEIYCYGTAVKVTPE